MAGIYSLLGLPDGDTSFVNTIGAQVIYDAASAWLAGAEADLNKASSVFVAGETDKFKFRYKLPGGGRMQEVGSYAPNAAVRPIGSWDVALPLKNYEEALASSLIDAAYMTVRDVQLSLENIRERHTNAYRAALLRALFNNAEYTFDDKQHGSLTVLPLANGDAVLYPPLPGVEVEATHNHYLETGYAASSISDANNPFPTVRKHLEEHFGAPTGYGNIVVFVNTAQIAKIEDLTDFDPVKDNHIIPGANVDQPTGLPNVPGRVVGRANGVWVVEWMHIPDGWALAVDPDQPAPLMKRTHPASTGLQSALHLAGETGDHPLLAKHYRAAFGFGVTNRLNGLAIEFGTGGTYTVPTAFA